MSKNVYAKNISSDFISLSVVVLNINTEVFKIHDMNTLYKIGDLHTMANTLCTRGASLAMGKTCPT